MGRSLDLSPIVILLSLIFWGWLWGVVGMFLAVPITSAIKIIFESFPALQPLAAAMSGE
jgi:predicted PurR-regulated permease PerM